MIDIVLFFFNLLAISILIKVLVVVSKILKKL